MKNIVVLLILFMSVSCQKFLTQRPQDFLSPENYYETEEHLNYALNGVYATMAENGTYASHMLGRLGLDADEGYNNYAQDEATVSDYSVTSGDAKIQLYWTVLYKGIDRANRLLENLHKPTMNETKREHIKGQALFLRSYYYLLLVTRFRDIPLMLQSAPDGTPESVQIEKSPAKIVYEQILKDMETASELVPDVTAINNVAGRVSKSAVWGMMARVCLYMAGHPVNDESKYEKAIYWANKVKGLGYHQLNTSYENIFIKYARDEYDMKESIWEVEFWGNGVGVFGNSAGYVGVMNGIGQTNSDIWGRTIAILYTTRWHLGVYKAGDLRRDWTIAPFRFENDVKRNWTASVNQVYTRYCGKWRREYETLTPKDAKSPQNFPLLRYSDVLLMLAEAENEFHKGPTDAAYEAVNTVRRRGFGYDVNEEDETVADVKDLTYEQFRELIQDERTRELGFEGLRKNDLVRWNIFYDRMQDIYVDTEPGNNAAIRAAKRTYENASERDEFWPLPSYELGINRKLIQHDEWLQGD